MPTRPRLFRPAALFPFAAALSICVVGCDTTGETTWLGKQDRPPGPAENVAYEEDPRGDSAGVRDTIQAHAWLEGMRRMSVGGYGLVVGLGKNGTSQCPHPIREYMLQDMRARYRLGGEFEALKHLSPENLLDNEGTAVVTVYGEIPAAAQRGARFDLTVRALGRTGVRSLEGGWLMPCTLKLWAGEQPVGGRVLGEGAGQVFINPFGLKEGAATKTNPRVGRVLGGGVAKDARKIRLVLTNPSAAIAKRIMYLINRRFGVEPYKTADAISPHAVTLRVPERWHGVEPHFLELLMHLYVPAGPSFPDLRLKALCEEAVQPEAALADISLAWEGLGKNVLPAIRRLYTHEKHEVSFFAARAGLRLGDDLAMEVMARHAGEPESPFRELAVEELGLAPGLSRVVMVLRPLLDADDQRIRQLAYEGLRHQRDPIIRSFKVGRKRGFVVDVVPCPGRYLIAAKRSGKQRIILFGSDMRCHTPVFYSHRNETVMITADSGSSTLKLVRRTPVTGRLNSPISCPNDVVRLIMALGQVPKRGADGHYKGLGLTYSQVVEVLYDLCADKTIDATFVLQGGQAAEIVEPPSQLGRPESEL